MQLRLYPDFHVKPFTTDWTHVLELKPSRNSVWDLNVRGWDSNTRGCDVNPAKTLLGTWTHMARIQIPPKSCLGLKPSQILAWDLNPRGWDSNSAKTYDTWFQDLMRLRFLMSHHRKNSVRDKVIDKWIYLDRNTLHRQSVGHHRGWMWPPWNLAWSLGRTVWRFL